MDSLAAFVTSVLIGPGDAIRQLILTIPLWVVRIIFILYPIVLLIWVMQMDESEVKGDLPGSQRKVDLRPYVAAAMIGQVIIYIVF